MLRMANNYLDALFTDIEDASTALAPVFLAEHLRKKLLALNIPEGTRLCSLSDLANRVGLGMGVIRETMQQLQSAGLIEIRQGAHGGVFTRRVRQDSLVRTLEALVHSNRVPREAAVEARTELESLCGRLAVLHATPEHILALRRNIEHMETLVDSPVEFARENVKFHLLISEASGNLVLAAVAGALRDLFFSDSIGVDYSRATTEGALRAHRRILKAIEEKNVEHVSDAVFGHAYALEDALRSAEISDLMIGAAQGTVEI
jgi:DNA-binding FadR family transcriptional regulator